MDRSRHAVVLWVLLGLFCFRVFAQLLQAFHPVAFLPPFDAWQSGAMSYRALVMAQLLIIIGYAVVAWRIGRGHAGPNRRAAAVLVGLGTIYFALMAARLALGLTILDGHSWWDRPIPSAFHLVLASFLLVASHFCGQPAEDSRAPGAA